MFVNSVCCKNLFMLTIFIVMATFLYYYTRFYLKTLRGIRSPAFVPTVALDQASYSITTMPNLPMNFVELYSDEETANFLHEARLRHSPAKDALALLLTKIGYSRTDSSGLVDRGRMFIFSKNQLAILFGGSVPSGEFLLDIGAGNGHITSQIASNFKHVIATELSTVMVKRLRNRGYLATSKVDDLNHETFGKFTYDMVMMLNILDRIDKPWTFLRQARDLLTPKTGRLLLTVVLPFCPFVEKGTNRVRPRESLPMKGGTCKDNATFEESLAILTKNVLIKAGFEIESWSKLPYLCEGNGEREYFALEDAIFVLKVKEEAESAKGIAQPIKILPGILRSGGMEKLPARGLIDWMFLEFF